MQDDTVNYNNGMRFECQGSGNCCVSRNSYGYVYLSKKDLIRLSKHMKLTINKFIDLYCSFTKKDKFLHLKEIKDDKNCIFLKAVESFTADNPILSKFIKFNKFELSLGDKTT